MDLMTSTRVPVHPQELGRRPPVLRAKRERVDHHQSAPHEPHDNPGQCHILISAISMPSFRESLGDPTKTLTMKPDTACTSDDTPRLAFAQTPRLAPVGSYANQPPCRSSMVNSSKRSSMWQSWALAKLLWQDRGRDTQRWAIPSPDTTGSRRTSVGVPFTGLS